jgi:hypothetical protein
MDDAFPRAAPFFAAFVDGPENSISLKYHKDFFLLHKFYFHGLLMFAGPLYII